MDKELEELTRDNILQPKIAQWFAQMEKIREKLVRFVSKLSIDELDFSPNKKQIETIGTLLLHIAAVEWSWIFMDIDGKEMDFDGWKYAFSLRPEVNIPQIQNNDIIVYLDRLNLVRTEVHNRLIKMTDNELEKIIESDDEKYTIEWILYHILEHEIIHLGQIQLIYRLYKLEKKKAVEKA
ncbi:MAG TPA: DinB family protein [Candidatus Bathyarchaeia archaeon]|nr:DinB family protein [Candidatus Bathyarchaeia archaeon]